MNITCPHCQAKLNLPDDKIPKDRDSSFKCPKCRESVHIRADQAAASVQAPAKDRPGSGTGGSPGGAATAHGAEVLVCMADAHGRNLVTAAAERSGWTVESAASVAQALGRLEYDIFSLMVMDDTFDSEGALAAYLNELDMSLRRRICLVLVSSSAKTGDAMAAMHASSNFVVNSGDMSDGTEDYLSGILASARTDHENFYRVYNDSMRAVGKA